MLKLYESQISTYNLNIEMSFKSTNKSIYVSSLRIQSFQLGLIHVVGHTIVFYNITIEKSTFVWLN